MKILWFIKGNLGDCILTLNVLLKISNFASVEVCTSSTNLKLITELCPDIKVYEFNNSFIKLFQAGKWSAAFKHILKFRKKITSSYDYVVEPYRWNSGFFVEQFLVKGRVKLNKFLTKGVVEYNVHESIINEKYAELICKKVDFNIFEGLSELLKNIENTDISLINDVIIHPFSSEEKRNLKPSTVIGICRKYSNSRVLILGTPDDRHIELAAELIKSGVDNYKFEVKFFEFRYLAILLKSAKCVIASESFISHYSAVIGCRTIGLYSGVADSKQWYVRGDDVTTIRKEIYCSPCFNSRVCNSECLDFDLKFLPDLI